MISSYIPFAHKLYKAISSLQLDVLVIVESKHALYGVPAAKLAGVRCVVWEHFNFNVDLGKRKDASQEISLQNMLMISLFSQTEIAKSGKRKLIRMLEL